MERGAARARSITEAPPLLSNLVAIGSAGAFTAFATAYGLYQLYRVGPTSETLAELYCKTTALGNLATFSAIALSSPLRDRVTQFIFGDVAHPTSRQPRIAALTIAAGPLAQVGYFFKKLHGS